MDRKQHYIVFLIFTVIFFPIISYITGEVNWSILKGLVVSGVIMNPDYFELNKKVHRWFISHSLLFPLLTYWCFRDFIKTGFWMDYFGVVLYLPVMLHLLGDLKGTYGYGLIDCYPLKHLGHQQSVLWIWVNFIIMFSSVLVWIF